MALPGIALALLSALGPLTLHAPPPGDGPGDPVDARGNPDRCGRPLLITELHIDPHRVPDRRGEFIEVYNHGDRPVDLGGWTLGDGGRERHVIAPRRRLIVRPREFAVLGASTDRAVNGGIHVDYAYHRFQLGNRADRVQLRDACGTLVFDLAYPGSRGWPGVARGRSVEQLRDPALGPPSRWGRARLRMPSGDRGTPGFAPWSPAHREARSRGDPAP